MSSKVNSDFLDRLVSNYKLANDFIKNQSNLRSKEWGFLHDLYHEKFLDKNNIVNFRGHKVWLSDGMDSYGMRNDAFSNEGKISEKNIYQANSNRTAFLKSTYLLSDFYNSIEENPPEDSKFTFDIHNKRMATEELKKMIKWFGEDFVLKNLIIENIGNSPIAYKYKNIFYDEYNLCHLKYFHDLKKKVFDNSSNIRNVIEIGGGFGVLADYLIKNYKLKFISLDLPAANLLTSYYLNKSQKDKKFFLIDDYLKEGSLNSKLLNEYDVFILPSNIKIEQDIIVDLFINIRSMMEMDFDVVKNYFKLIHKHISDDGYFCNINRYISNRFFFDNKELFKDKPLNASDIAKYPYDENWKVVLSETSYRHLHVHTLITKREKDISKSNIRKELEKIDQISKRFIEGSLYHKIKIFKKNLRIFLRHYIFLFIRKFFSRENEKKIKAALIKIKGTIFTKG